MSSIGVAMMIGAALIAAISQVLLKKSALQSHKSAIYEYLNPYVILGYGLMFLTMGINMIAYKSIDYKYGPILNASSYVFVLILGKMFLGEKLTAKKIVGNILIIIGIVVYSLG